MEHLRNGMRTQNSVSKLDVEEIRAEEEQEPEEQDVDWKTLMKRLHNFAFERPDVIFSMLEVLLERLKDKEIFNEEELKAIIREGVRRWKG